MPEPEHNEVQIHIDQQQYESPNPTTGANALQPRPYRGGAAALSCRKRPSGR